MEMEKLAVVYLGQVSELAGAAKSLGEQFGFAGALVLLLLAGLAFLIWHAYTLVTTKMVEHIERVSTSGEKTALATEKISEMIDLLNSSMTAMNERIESVDDRSKRMCTLVRRCVLAAKELVPDEYKHVAAQLEQIAHELDQTL